MFYLYRDRGGGKGGLSSSPCTVTPPLRWQCSVCSRFAELQKMHVRHGPGHWLAVGQAGGHHVAIIHLSHPVLSFSHLLTLPCPVKLTLLLQCLLPCPCYLNVCYLVIVTSISPFSCYLNVCDHVLVASIYPCPFYLIVGYPVFVTSKSVTLSLQPHCQ